MWDGFFSRTLKDELETVKGKRRSIFRFAGVVSFVGLGMIFSSLGAYPDSFSISSCSPVVFSYAWLFVFFLRGLVIGIKKYSVCSLRDRACLFLSVVSCALSMTWFCFLFRFSFFSISCFSLLTASVISAFLLRYQAKHSILLTLIEIPVLFWLLVNLFATLKLVVVKYV